MESGKIIVVANQKGGVAKTSTVRNLSYALAEMGKKVLVVDFDPQYNLTTSFGVLPTQAPYNTGTLITNLLLDESLPDTNEFIQKIGSCFDIAIIVDGWLAIPIRDVPLRIYRK